MMELQRLRQVVSWQTGEQLVKLCFGCFAIVCLVLINSNLHQLVSCLSQSLGFEAPLTAGDCNYSAFGVESRVELQCCQGTFRVRVNGSVDVIYLGEQSARVTSWMRSCWLGGCPRVNQSSLECPTISWLASFAYLCFDPVDQVVSLFLSGHSFVGPEAALILDSAALLCNYGARQG